ncbi:glycosyltransferase [Marinomonas sp. C2222]|uniref:Glycosyltransferase n=1 Tax=Marinomonas sargassi TaxID=2984494 RepID=A0ABT2YVH9_9GAMM|nr:MJ1255/VC2487 family glycosyltransferase [Marinomonas sargassi]MCV2403868.1 glycosyltransferase [Marinomonas sargassi]
MKVLYGVQGTGNGHITRARAMAAEFSAAGVEVDYIFSGRDPEDYFDMSAFGEYRHFRGLSFVARNGKLDLGATLFKANLFQLYKDVCSIDTRGYDIVITDYEPVVAWAAKQQGIACIGFGHQYAFVHDIPRYKKNRVAQWIMSNFAPATMQLGSHWHHFGHSILPPLIHEKELSNAPDEKNVLVYLPFENSEAVFDWLEAIPEYHFRFHCKDIDPGLYGNVEVFPFSRNEFQKNLSECASVLSNAGFELNSEALQFGRRILVKPLTGQIEQHSNAIALELLGAAKAADKLDSNIIKEWLETSKVTCITYPNVAKAVVDWLQDNKGMSLSDLCDCLWEQTLNLPAFVNKPDLVKQDTKRKGALA